MEAQNIKREEVLHTDSKPKELEILYHNAPEKGETLGKIKTSFLVGLHHDVAFLQSPSRSAAFHRSNRLSQSTPRLQYPRARRRPRKHRHTSCFRTAAPEEPEFFTGTIASPSQAEVTGTLQETITYPTLGK